MRKERLKYYFRVEGWMYFVKGIAFNNEANKIVWLFKDVDLAL